MLLLTMLAAAQAAPENPFVVLPEPLELGPGQAGAARVTIQVPAGTFLYVDQAQARVLDAAGLEVSEPSFPPGLVKVDPVLGSDREVWDMDVVVEVPVVAPTAEGEHPLQLELRYQGCKGSLCYLPETEVVRLPVTVGAAPAGPAPQPIWTGGEGPVQLRVQADGEAITATFEQDRGWHLTQAMTSIEVDEAGNLRGCKQSWPTVHERPDPALPGSTRGELDGDFTARAELAGAAGEHIARGVVRYQACKDDKCLLPQSLAFAVPVTLAAERPATDCDWSHQVVTEEAPKKGCSSAPTAPGLGALFAGLAALAGRRKA